MRRIGTVFSALVIYVMVGGAARAQARTVPALAGRALFGSEEACFNVNNSNGWVLNQNNCGAVQKWWEIPVVLDSFVNRAVTMSVMAPDTTLTKCRAVAIGNLGQGVTASPYYFASVANTPVQLTTMNVNVSNNGYIFVDCLLGPNNAALISTIQN